MNYAIRLVEERSPDGGTHWFAAHPALPGCHAIGGTQSEAITELSDAQESWLRIARENDGDIPAEDQFQMMTVQYLIDPPSADAVAVGQADEATIPVEV